jgi:hypothetical protein
LSVPALVVVCPVEGEPRLRIYAASLAEEQAVFVWLANSMALPTVAVEVLELFGDLLVVERDEGEA